MSEITRYLEGRFPRHDVLRPHLDELLSAYKSSGLASPHMVEEITSGDDGKLYARVWEAMLYRHLSSLQFEFLCNDVSKSGETGPDFGILHQGETIWIEAVTPAPEGIPADYLEPPKKGEVEFKPVPQEPRLLRWTSVLRDKREKLEFYRHQHIINDGDRTVIAVNSCRLQDYAPNDLGSSRWPFAVEAVFPIGPIAFPVIPGGKPDGEAINVPRHVIQKPNGSPVPTDNFLNPRYANVSAIMGCYRREMANGELPLTVVHNPLATARLPIGILGAKKEYVAEDKGDHYVVRPC
jgi:hypothetical protein